jgi:hypothetical protein
MEYNVVTNYHIIQTIKRNSKYFEVSLGLASTMTNQAGDRVFNDKDDFAFYYNTLYRTNILCQGKIGNITFYTDHYIKGDKISFYYDKEEYIFDYDQKLVIEKGVDVYLGHLIKKIEIEIENRLIKEQEVIEEQKAIVGDASTIIENPGNVRYADLKAYLEKMRSERLLTNK